VYGYIAAALGLFGLGVNVSDLVDDVHPWSWWAAGDILLIMVSLAVLNAAYEVIFGNLPGDK